MPTRFSVVVDDDRASDVERLAHEHGLTEEEVLRQLLALGIQSLEEDQPGGVSSSHDVPGRTDTDR